MSRAEPKPPEELVAFCTREYPRLVGALGLYTGDRDVAEDCAQEALARVCSRWEHVRTLAAPGAWAHRVGINVAHGYYRRRRTGRRAQRLLEDGARTLSAQPEPGEALALQAAVAALPKRQRTVVVLHYYLGYPVAELADVLRTPEGTVKSLLHRGRAALRVVLEPSMEVCHD